MDSLLWNDGDDVTRLPSVNDTWTPKAWQPVTHRDWCYDENTSPNPGLVYIKIPKSSSSTMAGINIRLARRIGSQVLEFQEAANSTTTDGAPTAGICSHTYIHARAAQRLRERAKTTAAISSGMDTGTERNPLMWTFLRDPAARQISSFFHFRVSRRHFPYTPHKLMKSLREAKNFSYGYVKKPESLVDWGEEVASGSVSISSLPLWYVMQRTALEPYNFIGLVERRDESLAAMKLLWNLTTADLIVLSSKSSGGYDDGEYHEKCVKILRPPQPLPDVVSSFIDNGFRQDNLDYLLYSMANATLDKTIEHLGTERVAREVQELQRYQRIAEESCFQEAVFPCSANGTRQVEAAAESCYYNDFGCGHVCVDQVLGRYRRRQQK